MKANVESSRMTDREYRVYKRKLRRQREQRKRIASVLAAILLVVICLGSYRSFSTKAVDNTPDNFKYYTSVIVKSGDTLWSISDKFIDYSEYRTKESYIKEVCSINHIEDESEIRIGQELVVPYYSTEFVK